MKPLTIEERMAYAKNYEAARQATKVKVWNIDNEPYTEPFDEQLIYIPANDFVMMSFSKAKKFRSGDAPLGKNKYNEQLCTKVKAIRVEEPSHNMILEVMKGNKEMGEFNSFYEEIETALNEPDTNSEITAIETKSVTEGFKCPVCNKLCKNVQGLQIHLKVHKN